MMNTSRVLPLDIDQDDELKLRQEKEPVVAAEQNRNALDESINETTIKVESQRPPQRTSLNNHVEYQLNLKPKAAAPATSLQASLQ